jgi:hypothetical protein
MCLAYETIILGKECLRGSNGVKTCCRRPALFIASPMSFTMLARPVLLLKRFLAPKLGNLARRADTNLIR